MGKEQNITSSAPEPADVIALLGPAQVLSTESASDFGRVLDKLLCCLNAQHILDVMLIRDFAETSWQIQRYSRLRGLSFERRFKESLDFQAQRLKAQHARKHERIGSLAEHATLQPADVAQATYLEEKVDASVTEVEEILKRTPSELDHAHTLEKSVAFHKDVEIVIASLSRRRNEALRTLDFYRAGLGKRVDDAMKKIIDVEHKLVEEPAKTPKQRIRWEGDDLFIDEIPTAGKDPRGRQS